MGQYSQWLHYHEVDQQLQEQLATLERELAQLQEQVQPLENATSDTDNTIMQALIRLQKAEQLHSVGFSTHDELQQTSPQDISSDLPTWNHSSNFATQDIQEQFSDFTVQPITDAVEDLFPVEFPVEIPEESNPFTNTHSQTDPQLKVPWWLRNQHNATDQDTSPIDKQSMRNDRLVERWFERWKDADTTNINPGYKGNTQEDQAP